MGIIDDILYECGMATPEMLELVERHRDHFEDTYRRGCEHGRKEIAQRMLAYSELTYEDIAEACNLPLEKVQELAAKMAK